MAEKILLIAPRWMTNAVVQQKVQSWREKVPGVQLTLLSAAALEDATLKPLFFPAPTPRAMTPFAYQLRRTRFRRAVVLTDNTRGDVGYGEAKFWAFAANTRRREFEGKPLTLVREAKAKRRVTLNLAVHGIATLCRLAKVPLRSEVIVKPALMNSARTFVYLQHAVHQHGLTPGRVVLVGADWDEETAQRCDWQVVQENGEVQLALIDGWRENQIPKPGVCLFCFASTTSSTAMPPDVHVLENREAFFDDQARDIWLVEKQ